VGCVDAVFFVATDESLKKYSPPTLPTVVTRRPPCAGVKTGDATKASLEF